MEYTDLWKIGRADGGGRNPHEAGLNRRGEPSEASGDDEADCERIAGAADLYYSIGFD